MLSLDKNTEILIKHYNDRLNIAQNNNIKKYILHKIRHIYWVLSASQRIMIIDPIFIDISKEIIKKIEISSLLHDIWRFYQFEWDVLFKSHQFEHWDRWYDILKDEWIDDLWILLSVKYHNKYKLDDFYDEIRLLKKSDIKLYDEIVLITKLVRDADKLQNIEYLFFNNDILKIEWDKANDFSEEILEDLWKWILVDFKKSKNKSKIDYCLMYLSWWFDINFEWTKKILISWNLKNNFIEMIKRLWWDHKIIKTINNIF